jgi:hypothetical protein
MFTMQVSLPFPESTSSAAASHARTSRTPARARGSLASGPACGSSLRESIARWDPVSLSWKTSQRSLLEDWTPFSERWPTSGMMLAGSAYGLPMLAPPIGEPACSLWPTPAACNPNETEDLRTWEARRAELKAKKANGNGCGTPLGVAVRLWPTAAATGSPNLRTMVSTWPTPCAQDGAGARNKTATRSKRSPKVQDGTTLTDAMWLEHGAGSKLNPAWVEMLMGFPPGWTDIGGPLPREKRSAKTSQRARSKKPSTEPQD